SCHEVIAGLVTFETGPSGASDDASAPAPILRGARVDRYVIEETRGAGGLGVVHAARDVELERRVAVKVLRGDRGPDARARLIREARTLARLSHPNVVT